MDDVGQVGHGHLQIDDGMDVEGEAMTQKIAVAIIHGMGQQDPHFADGMQQELLDRFAGRLGDEVDDPASELVIRPVYWAPVLQNAEEKLWKQVKKGGELDFTTLRRFLVDFAADAIAYQPTPQDRRVYDGVHEIFANVLDDLATGAGVKAPLCIIAHSLGSVIASNYFYDLQVDPAKGIIADSVRAAMGDTPLERGETLAQFYTMGSPIALWSLRYRDPDFGVPIAVPSPQLAQHYPNVKGEWVNYYDEDDVIAYPLKTINDAYRKVVKADRGINAGGLLSSWNPASHLGYWTDNDITKPIAAALAATWRSVNR